MKSTSSKNSSFRLHPSSLTPGWQIVKFGEIAKEVKLTTKDPAEDGLEFYIGLDHLDPQSMRITRKGIIAEDNPSFTRRFSVGQILFGKRRCYQRKAAVADFEGICSGDIIVMDAIPKKILPGLLPFIIQSDAFFDWAEKTSSGSLSPRTKWKSLAEFEFPLPPIERQQEILEVLEKLEEGVRKIYETLDAGYALKKVLQYRLTNYGINGSGNEPTHWKKGTFIDLATLQRGFDLPEQNRIKGKYPIFASTNIVGYHKEYMVDAPGVVTGRSGTIGQVAYTDEQFWPLNTVLYIKNFHGNNAKYVKYFIEAFHVERFATGTGVPTLNRNIVHKEKVNIPPVNEQEQIVEILSATDDAIASIDQRKNNYLKLRSDVFGHLFGGVQ